MARAKRVRKFKKIVFKENVLHKVKPDDIVSTLFLAGSEVPEELAEKKELQPYIEIIEVEEEIED